jgi:enolase
MSKIKEIKARQILDSRGNPTVEVDVITEQGHMGRAAVPSGASTGTREALELRDGDKSYYLGRSVRKAIDNINKIITPQLIGKDCKEQGSIDGLMLELDGTDFKSKLGANALLAVSMANCRAAALASNKPLYRYLIENLHVPTPDGKFRMPCPLMNIINGGQHASNNLDFQEFMILPKMKKSFAENLRAGVEVFHNLKTLLSSKNYSVNVGDEGGFAPDLQSHEEAVELILKAIEKSGYKPGEDIAISLDCAASEFYKDGIYEMQGKKFSTDDMISLFGDFVKKYPIYSIEDGLAEGDHAGWTKLTKTLGEKVVTVGDDLFVTNKKILAEGSK